MNSARPQKPHRQEVKELEDFKEKEQPSLYFQELSHS